MKRGAYQVGPHCSFEDGRKVPLQCGQVALLLLMGTCPAYCVAELPYLVCIQPATILTQVLLTCVLQLEVH